MARESVFSRLRSALDVEERLGTNWLNKLGIVILVLGIAFFLAYQLQTLGPVGKVLVGYVVSAALLGSGIYFERSERYRILARAGIGGGWALLFFTTYAMYHVPAAHILSSQLTDLVLLLLVAAAMVTHTLRYDQRALQVKPDYIDALRGLAEAQFDSADFVAAAETYGKLLDKVTPNQDSDVHHYAQALAVSDRRSAARAFRSRLRNRPISLLANAELSGLELLAGNPQPAQQAKMAAARDPNTDPQLIATLGRWHYLAGNYEPAQQLLATAAQQRPADADINTDSAWAAVELRRYADAITIFDRNSGQRTAARMGLAVARWQSRQPDAALQDFAAAVQLDSRWDNARWVAALYSTTVAKSITEMKAERERRLQDEQRQRRLARSGLPR